MFENRVVMPTVQLILGDCLEVLPTLAANSVDAVATDPPYGLGFMGKDWDHGVPGMHFWTEAFRVAKPGAHMLAFGGTRTFHRLACAIEDAGWEMRDTIMWVYGSGFPKSLDVSKAIDKAAGAERTKEVWTDRYHDGGTRQDLGYSNRNGAVRITPGHNGNTATLPATPDAIRWQGWGTALKPAWEPIIVARKPVQGTVAANVLAWGTGAINVDGGRVEITDGAKMARNNKPGYNGWKNSSGGPNSAALHGEPLGRWPANLIHDGSDEVLRLFPEAKAGVAVRHNSGGCTFGGDNPKPPMADMSYSDTGSAARFFYCAKASKADRDEGCEGMPEIRAARFNAMGDNPPDDIDPVSARCPTRARNHHPTVKPTALMRYLVRLVTPPGGMVLDPFMGSGSTGKAALLEGFGFVGIEMSPEYLEIAKARVAAAEAQAQLAMPMEAA